MVVNSVHRVVLHRVAICKEERDDMDGTEQLEEQKAGVIGESANSCHEQPCSHYSARDVLHYCHLPEQKQ